MIISFPRPRWNSKKADWAAYSKNLDKCLGWIPPTQNNYERDVGVVTSTAKNSITRSTVKYIHQDEMTEVMNSMNRLLLLGIRKWLTSYYIAYTLIDEKA